LNKENEIADPAEELPNQEVDQKNESTVPLVKKRSAVPLSLVPNDPQSGRKSMVKKSESVLSLTSTSARLAKPKTPTALAGLKKDSVLKENPKKETKKPERSLQSPKGIDPSRLSRLAQPKAAVTQENLEKMKSSKVPQRNSVVLQSSSGALIGKKALPSPRLSMK